MSGLLPQVFPQPRQVELTGAGPLTDQPARERVDDELPAEGFRITATVDDVLIEYADDNGRRYGRATLGQLRETASDRLPGMVITDWPDFGVRGFLLDISRDRVPTRATLERLVEVMALARVNHFELYTEHTFAYADHEVVWRDASPITPDDVRWLDALCRDHGIELVPNQNTFGHLNRWLEHAAYQDRAECPDGYELIPDILMPASVLEPTVDNADFALALLDELLPLFTSRQVNVNCDEPFELGHGRSKDLVERRGMSRVYLEHVRRIVEPLIASGHQVLMWGDGLRHAPALLAEVPEGTTLVMWTYEAPRADGEGPEVPDDIKKLLVDAGIDLDSHRGFAVQLAPLAGSTVPFWVAPGTSSWNSFVGRVDNAYDNLLDAAVVGLDRGASGYLNTDWGDNGHHQPPSVSFGPMLYGGAVAWSQAANRDVDVAAALDRHVFADREGGLGALLDRIGRVWGRTGQEAFNASPLHPALTGVPALVTGELDPAAVHEIVRELDSSLAELAASKPDCADADLVIAELAAAIRLARHGAYRLLRTVGAAPPDELLRTDLAETIELQRAAWLARSRPGGLDDSLAPLESALREYGATT